LSFAEAMMTGLARDGGLYVPETVPQMTKAEIAALAGLSYGDLGLSGRVSAAEPAGAAQ